MLKHRVKKESLREQAEFFAEFHGKEKATKFLETSPEVEELPKRDSIPGAELWWSKHAIARGLIRRVSFESISIMKQLKEMDLEVDEVVHIHQERLDRALVVCKTFHSSFIVITCYRGIEESKCRQVWI